MQNVHENQSRNNVHLFFQADLIHLGAKYSPCMRPDKNVIDAIELDKRKERETACCVRNAKEDGCLQLPKKKCSVRIFDCAV